MSGDHRDAADAPEMLGNGDRQRRSFFRIGGRAQFIQQHQRVCRRGARDEVDIGDVGGERRKILLDGLVVADIGQHRIEHRQLGAVRGDGNAGLRHQGQQANRFQGHGFSAGVRAGDDQFQAFAFEFDADGNDVPAFCFQVALQQRVAGIDQNQPSGAGPDSRGRGCPHVVLAGPIVPNTTGTQL